MKVLLQDLNNGYQALLELTRIPAKKDGTTAQERAHYYYRLGSIYRDARTAIDILKDIELRLMEEHGISKLPNGTVLLQEGCSIEGFNREMLEVVRTQSAELYGDRFKFSEFSHLIDLDLLNAAILGDLLGWLIEDDTDALESLLPR